MIPFPKHTSDGIFQNSSDELHPGVRIACVGHNGGPYDTGQFARGFFAAAHQLLRWDVPQEEIESLPIEAQVALAVSIDLKVYPIVYCYRHAIELAVKHLLLQIPRYFNEPISPSGLAHHVISEWWEKLVPYLERLRSEVPDNSGYDPDVQRILTERLNPDCVSNVGSIISELDAADKRSTTFRFAIDKSGNAPLAHRSHIVLDKLFKFMLPVNLWFNDLIDLADLLAGPTPGLEPRWWNSLQELAGDDGAD